VLWLEENLTDERLLRNVFFLEIFSARIQGSAMDIVGYRHIHMRRFLTKFSHIIMIH